MENVSYYPVIGQSWIGAAEIAIVATQNGLPAPGAPITNAWCQVYRNQVPFDGEAVRAPNSTGATAMVARFEYSAKPTDVIHLCTRVTVGTRVMNDSILNGTCAEGDVTGLPPF